jgi:hypothetical protein
LSLKQRKRVTISDYSFVAGTGVISSPYSEMGQKGEQPKENLIASQSIFLSCSQDDASIT